MTDFFDWLTASAPGHDVDRLRDRFRLSTEEMRRATQALAPAFLLGFGRLTAQPDAFGDFIRRASAMEGSAGAMPGSIDGADAMRGFLAQLFGGQALSDAVARHASMMAGIAPDTITKMMPQLALLSVQAMTRMAGANWGGQTPFAGDAGGQALAETLRRSANAVEAFNRPSGTGASGRTATGADLQALFADALTGGFPWMRPGAPAAPHAEPADGSGAGLNPFAAFQPMLEAFSRGLEREPAEAAPERAFEQAPDEAHDPMEAFARMAEAGRSVQESYTLEMLALFDRHRPHAD